MMVKRLFYLTLVFATLCYLAYGGKGNFYTERFVKIDILPSDKLALVGEKKSFCMAIDSELATYIKKSPPVTLQFSGKPPIFDENGTLLWRFRLLFDRKITPPEKLHLSNYDSVMGRKHSNWYIDIDTKAKECDHKEGVDLRSGSGTVLIYYPPSKLYDFLQPFVKIAQLLCLGVGYIWYWIELHLM